MKNRLNKYMTLFMGGLLLLSLSGCQSQATSSTIVSVKTATANKSKLQTVVSVTGVLVPAQTVNISSKISGQVTTLSLDVGSTVNVGDTVITLETKTLHSQLQQAQASLEQTELSMQTAENSAEQAKINLDSISKTYDRTKALYESGAVPLSQLDDVSTKLQLAQKTYENASGPALNQIQASINTAKANISSINVQLENANITSPISGTITNRNINPGEIASQGVTLLTIADTSILKLKGTVSQDILPFLKSGLELDMNIDIYPGKVFKGQITNISPMAVSTGAYFPIEISTRNSGELKSGLTARTNINITGNEEITVPLSAVIQNNGQSYAFVIKDGKALKRTVTTGLKNEKEIQILKGIEAGEKVATTNVNNLIDNMPVSAD